MNYQELIDLLFKSIEIIGAFLAIVVGLLMSKILNMKCEQNELKEKVTEIDKEIEEYDKKLKEKEERLKSNNESLVDNNKEINSKIAEDKGGINNIISSIQEKGENDEIYSLEEIENKLIISNIEEIKFEIGLRKMQKSLLFKRINSINKSTDIVLGIWVFIFVSMISIVFPFLVVCYKNYLICFKKYVFTYLIHSFILSFLLLIGYVIYEYKRKE